MDEDGDCGWWIFEGQEMGDEWGGDVLELECMDTFNAVRIELRREGPYKPLT